ncbi:MAG: hypothetical protein B7Z66_06825 [Chromatiales bacterium 21-64-14]|nr:MAG: hypothetical protein B7Z66_06825 [Chromatiales bacterium 21-64-14]
MRRITVKGLRILGFVMLGATTWLMVPAWAADTPASWYDVELIVFARITPDPGAGETWPANPGQPDLQGAVELSAPGASPNDVPPAPVLAPGTSSSSTPATSGQPVPYQTLAHQQFRLNRVDQILSASPRYRVLLHVAWQQPGVGPTAARPVHIQLPDGTLNGTVQLSRTRYLHVAVDLLYRPDGTATAGTPTSISLPVYRMHQQRRIDPGVLNYFDHPVFGVLLQARPIQVSGTPLDTSPPAADKTNDTGPTSPAAE